MQHRSIGLSGQRDALRWGQAALEAEYVRKGHCIEVAGWKFSHKYNGPPIYAQFIIPAFIRSCHTEFLLASS